MAEWRMGPEEWAMSDEISKSASLIKAAENIMDFMRHELHLSAKDAIVVMHICLGVLVSEGIDAAMKKET